MNTRKHRTHLLGIALGALTLGASAYAQVTSDIPLYIADHGDGAAPGIDTLYWGVNPAATNGKDASLGEEEQPPAPPEGVFDARWVNVGSSSDFGQGVKKNYRAYTSPQQTDTFRLKAQPGFKPGSAGYPMVLAWPDLRGYFTSASLRFVDGDGNPTTQDMMTANSFTFGNPSSVTSTITIIAARPVNSSSVPFAEAARELRLEAAPNPVAKGSDARITYVLPQGSAVTMKLYDGAGALARTLLDRQPQTRGEQTVRFSTDGLAVGGYHYVLSVGGKMAGGTLMIVDR